MMKATAPTSRCLILLLIGGVLLVAACSDDSPTTPPVDPGEDGVIEIPGEVATLAAAIAAAAPGDTLLIASGTHAGAAVVTKELVIMGAAGGDARPILDTSGGPLRIELADTVWVELRDLRLRDGETAIELELTAGRAWMVDCEVSGATHGVTVDGDGSAYNVTIDRTVFRDCGNDNGNGAGLRIWGRNQVSVRNSSFTDTGGGSGVAATVSDESRLHLEVVDLTGLDAGNNAVTASTGEGRLMFTAVRFEGCAGTLVHVGGVFLLLNAEFVDCHGTMIRQQSENAEFPLFGFRVRGCTGTFLDLAVGRSASVSWSSFDSHDGTLFALGEGAALNLLECTIVDAGASMVSVDAGGGQVEMVRCLVVDAVTPVVDGGTVAIRSSDLWRTDGAAAWAGLEEFLGVDGNIEADPLFCDAAAGDYRVEEGSPCVLGGGMVIGAAYGVGCE